MVWSNYKANIKTGTRITHIIDGGNVLALIFYCIAFNV